VRFFNIIKICSMLQVTITKASKTAQVKNRAPAPIQISSEQLLREARDRKVAMLPRYIALMLSSPHDGGLLAT